MEKWKKFIEDNTYSFRHNANGLIEMFPDKQGPVIHVKDAIRACEMVAGTKKRVSTPEEKELFKECRSIFADRYLADTGLYYSFSAADAGALKQLLHKIEEANREAGHPTNISFTADTFEALIKNLPEWYRTHQYSLTVINSKFNPITAEIRKRDGKKDNGVSADYIKRQLDILNS